MRTIKFCLTVAASTGRWSVSVEAVLMLVYSFPVQEFLATTGHLSAMEELAYRRLLDLYFLQEGPISPDLESVARRIRMEPSVVGKVVHEFFVKGETGWNLTWAEQVLDTYRRKRDVARSNGKAHKGGSSNLSGTYIGPISDLNRTYIGPISVADRFQAVDDSIPASPSVDKSVVEGSGSEEGGRARANIYNNISSTCTGTLSTSTESTILERESAERENHKSTTKLPSVEKPNEVSDDVWRDFLAHRVRRKAKLTPTAWKMIVKQSQLARKGLQEVLETMISMGWTGYRAEWEIRAQRGFQGPLKPSLLASTHIPNMPLGTANCKCSECITYREKKAKEYNPNL